MGKTSPHARAAPLSSKSSMTPNSSTPRRKSAEVLTPPVPPAYPSAPKPSPLRRDAVERVDYYKNLCLYLSSNYAVHVPRKPNSYAFNVHRYTDKYRVLSNGDPDIVPRIGSDRLPDELTTSSTKRVKRPGKIKDTLKKSLDDLNEEDDVQKDEQVEGEPVPKKPRELLEAEANAMNDSVDDEVNI